MSEWSKPEVAEQWKQAAAERNRHLAAATEVMFSLARLAPGMRVLDLGTGAADVALMAAERVGPSGSVVAVDSSEEMIQVAKASVREAGVANVTVRRMDAENIDAKDAPFDVVLARMVLMFVDLPRALGGIARVLAPRGRFAATVWSAIANNPYHAAILDVARESGAPAADSELGRAFGLADPAPLVDAARAAGFAEIDVRAVRGERRVSSLSEQIALQRRWPIVADFFAAQGDAARERAWNEIERRWRRFETADGRAVFPTEIIAIGAARAHD